MNKAFNNNLEAVITMYSQVCVHCLNKKHINATTNRLVTESCGHVKCMDCLLHEKAGCVACVEEPSSKEPVHTQHPEDGPPAEADHIEPEPCTEFPLKHFLIEADTGKEVQTEHVHDKKKKLETSHIRIETDGNSRYYHCTACKRKFRARSQVAHHAYCNGQLKPYQCPECNKSFATHSHFKYHMRVHRNERTYACEVCGDSFFQMSKLQRHKLKHTKEKKYPCRECGAAFGAARALRQHALAHAGERPLACAACPRRFRDASNYRRHVARHAARHVDAGARHVDAGARHVDAGARAARAHGCPRCPQAFAARRDLRRHAAVHDDAKPFRCAVCSRRFRRKDNLERHARNTHARDTHARDAHAHDTPPAPAPRDTAAPDDRRYQSEEKTKLEILNPLPPLPPEEMRKHLAPGAGEEALATILAANHQRRSVIFGPVRRAPEPAEYVHKIRKANGLRPRHALLPPIDETKVRQLARLDRQRELDVGAPQEKFRELYKKILYSSSEKEAALGAEEELHWRKKMKLGINW